MPAPPVWLLVAVLADLALPYAGPLLLVGAVLLLVVPAWRRRKGARRTAGCMLAACLVLYVCALPISQGRLSLFGYRLRLARTGTYHLDAPGIFGGIRFPAGSTVRFSLDGKLEGGDVPSPTVVAGFPLIGAFSVLGARASAEPSGLGGYDEVIGALAGPMTVNGIPCGPGPFRSAGGATWCVLAQDYLFQGHTLAGGQAIFIWRQDLLPPSGLDTPDIVHFGVLAAPEVLFDVSWPAGTMVGGITGPPEQMMHGPSMQVAFCLPAGKMTEVATGTTLHGPIAYYVHDDRLRVAPRCDILPQGGTDRDGYVQVGPDRFRSGSRADAASAWQWSDPLQR